MVHISYVLIILTRTFVEEKMQQVTSNVYVEIATRGCNAGFVVTRKGVVMVDTPFIPAEAKKLRAEIAKYGELRYVIDGEPHPDHISGNCWFGGTLIAHEGTRQAILDARPEDMVNMLNRMAPDQLPLDPEFKYRPPDITISQTMTIYLGDHTFHLINLPGHTPCQVAVYIPEERVVFTSDNVVQEFPLFFQSVPYAWLDSLKQLQKLEIDHIIPGHGNVCEKSFLQEMSATVQYWIEAVESAVKRGWSLEETQEKVTLADKYPQLSRNPFRDGIRRRSLARLYEVIKK
jgi:cyclase